MAALNGQACSKEQLKFALTADFARCRPTQEDVLLSGSDILSVIVRVRTSPGLLTVTVPVADQLERS